MNREEKNRLPRRICELNKEFENNSSITDLTFEGFLTHKIDSQEQTIKELREENKRIKYEFESNKRLLEGFAYFKMGGKKPQRD